MSDIAEGIGGTVEGALAGRAVETDHGEGNAGNREPEECENCGAMVTGSYCSNCGQKRDVHRSLAAIGHDLIHGVLHLDGKFWNTLPLLAFKPGQLTRRYIDGERAKFVSPMAMFLFSVFAMFAVFQMVGLSAPTDLNFGDAAKTVQGEGEAEANRLREQLEALPEDDPLRAEREADLEILEAFLARSEGIVTGKEAKPQTINATVDADGFTLTGIESLDNGVLKKWHDNPGLMLYKLQANGYKFSWLLIPLSIPFVWLLFAWKRRSKAYDHAVFVTYSLSFMSLLFITMSLLSVSPLGATSAAILFAIGTPLHLYKQLRRTYDLSRLSTLWRFFALFIFIQIVVLLFIQTLLILGAF